MSLPTKVYDQYGSLVNYKETISDFKNPLVSISWVPAEHKRRLTAYELLWSFYDQYSRDYRGTPESGASSNANDYILETGDSGWICDKIALKILGDSTSVNMPIPKRFGDEEIIQSAIESEGIDSGTKKRFQEKLKTIQNIKWKLTEREWIMRDWWEEQKVFITVYQNERKCVFLGDQVYYVEWDTKNACPKLSTYDPGFCFPYYDVNGSSLDEESNETVKDRFIIAWEEEIDDNKVTVFRDVYELRISGNSYKCYRKYGYYEWNDDISLLDFTDNMLVDNESDPNYGVWIDMGIDFLPLVWIPNDSMEGEDYGRSFLQRLYPMMDSLFTSYTDLRENADTLGGGIIGFAGKNFNRFQSTVTARSDGSGTNQRTALDVKIQPGVGIALGEDGKAMLVDTSNLQKALLDTIDKEEEKLTQISNISNLLTGKMKGSEIPSGIALRLLMQPVFDMIKPLRVLRQKYYARVFLLVQKMFSLYGSAEEKEIFSGDLYNAYLSFGNILPQDTESLISTYQKMEDVFSRKTILQIAKKDGFEIDVDGELNQIAIERQENLKSQQDIFEERTKVKEKDEKDEEDEEGERKNEE